MQILRNLKLRSTNGLTLLEMVVSIAIWVLVLTAVGVIFEQSLRVFKAATGRAEAIQQASAASEWLTRDIQEGLSLVAAGTSNITLVSPNLQCISYAWNSSGQSIGRKVGAGENYLVAGGVTSLALKYYDVNNQPLSDTVNNTLSLKTIELDIAAERYDKSFRLNSAARFDYDPASPWVKAYGGTNEDIIYSLRQAGDAYILGGSTNSYGAGQTDFLLVNADASGKITWAKAYGGTGSDTSKCLQKVSDGYVLGGDTFSFTAGFEDFMLLKTNTTGAIQWQKAYGGVMAEVFNSLQQTDDGGYILGGWTDSFGTLTYYDWFLLKANATGDFQWAKTYGGAGKQDNLFSAQQTADGYILGGGTASYGAGSWDFLLVKTNSTGNVTWANTYGGNGTEVLYCLQQTADGYILGGFTTSFGVNSSDFLLVKTNSTGNVTWAKTYGGNGDDTLYSLQQTADGGYILGGYTNSYAGQYDLLLLKTNTTGAMQWAKTYGGNSTEFLYSLQQTADAGYILGGRTNSYGAGAIDIILTKVNAAGAIGCCNITQSVYPVVNNVSLNATPCSPTETNVTNITLTTPSCATNNVTFTTANICPSP